MSPHAVRAESPSSRTTTNLHKYAVTKNAFLPAASLPDRLSDPYYDPWERACADIPSLIRDGTIRDVVARLPVLSADRLSGEPEWRRAYSMLSFLMHAHVWGGDKPAEVLPPQITVPFLRISARLELPPVLTYAGANLWNFSCSGPDMSNIDDLRTLFSFTGTESESWFLLISVAMEARGAAIIDTMLGALEAVRARDYRAVAAALVGLRECIDGVGVLLDRMYERCDPMTFYHQIRPFLAGSKNMGAAGLPRGVFYDEGEGRGQWRQLRGGSNGQSSLIQFFDIVLGVDHNGNGSSAPAPGERSFHAEVRDYMPGPHSRFLTHVARMGSIRELAMSAGDAAEQRELRAAYTAATDALATFRNKHIRIVTRYIVLPSRQPWKGASGKQNLASSSSGAGDKEELTGTGGTALVPFLKQARDETTYAGKLERRRAE